MAAVLIDWFLKDPFVYDRPQILQKFTVGSIVRIQVKRNHTRANYQLSLAVLAAVPRTEWKTEIK